MAQPTGSDPALSDLKPYGEAGPDLSVRFGREPLQGPLYGNQAPQLFHQEPHEILRQISRQAQPLDSNEIEITLSPDELGKVRMVVASGDTISVTIYAENRETLDLLRRNSEQLAKELRESGFADASLSFSDQGDGAEQKRWHEKSGSSNSMGVGAEAVTVTPTTESPRLVSLRQIDIRI
nr:flagellar hook-length control protein FliK [Paracoccus aestuariivivens]